MVTARRRLGIASRVLPADEVLPAALAVARDIADNTAPMSVAASKRLLWDSFELSRDEVGERGVQIHREVMAHDDAKEGVPAMQAGRLPRWSGRPVNPTR